MGTYAIFYYLVIKKTVFINYKLIDKENVKENVNKEKITR